MTVQSNTANINEVVEDLVLDYKSGDYTTPMMFWGQPGIGKSTAIYQAVQRLREELGDPDIKVWDIRLGYYTPEDLRGLPFFDKESGRYKVAPPSILPKPGERGILFLDELTLAPGAIGNLATQILQDRRIDEYVLPDGVMTVAAGNRTKDRVGASKMSMAVNDRFQHVEVETTVDDVVSYGYQSGWHPNVMSFLRWRPELLNTFDPKSGEIRFATPRSWERVSKIENRQLPLATLKRKVSGIVGDAPAAEYFAFIRIMDQLYTPQEIFSDPSRYAMPKEPSACWAQAGALISAVTHRTANALFQYISQYPLEYQYKIITDLRAKDESLLACERGTEWVRNHGDKL